MSDLVGELGEETRDVALVVGSIVSKVDNGGARALPVVTGCVFGTIVEDGTRLVRESSAWVVSEGAVVRIPEVNVSKGAHEEWVEAVVVIPETGDCMERSVVEVIAASLVDVTVMVKKVLVTMQ